MKVDFSQLNLKIGTEYVERIGSDCPTKSFKFVGLHLDEYLEWDHHINKVYGKLASGNYAISAAKNILPLNIRINLLIGLNRSLFSLKILITAPPPQSAQHLPLKCTTPPPQSAQHLHLKMHNTSPSMGTNFY